MRGKYLLLALVVLLISIPLIIVPASAVLNVTEYGVALYTSDSTNPAFPVANVGDLNNNTIWASNADPTNIYVRADFGAGVNRVVNNYTIKINPAYTIQVPYRWFFQGSNDAVNWDTLHDHSLFYGYHLTSPNTTYTSGTTTQGAYRYYQILIIDCEPGAAYASIGELVLANESFGGAASSGAVPDFIAIPNESAHYGMKVQFTNTTTLPGSTTFNWTFGDGNTTRWYETDFLTDESDQWTRINGDSLITWGDAGSNMTIVGGVALPYGILKLNAPTNISYGNYEFWVRTNDATVEYKYMDFDFFCDGVNVGGNPSNGYGIRMQFGGSNRIRMDRYNGGTNTALFIKDGVTLNDQTWYKLNVKTTPAGLMSVYLDDVFIGSATDTTYNNGFVMLRYIQNTAGNNNWAIDKLSARETNSTITYDRSTSANPTYTYDVAGQYTVIMNATNSTTYNRIFKRYYINLTSDTDTDLKSRLHFAGTSGSNTIEGEEGLAWTSSAFSISNTQAKWNSTSGAFLTSGSYIRTPSTRLLDFSTGDFTIETQVFPVSTGTNQFIVSRTSSPTFSNGWGIYHGSGTGSNDWHFYIGDKAANSTSSFSLPLNEWSHVAVVRKDGIITVYVNGTAATTPISKPGPFDTTGPLVYGYAGTGSESFIGYLDEPSYSSVARWDGDFTAPYAEYRGDLFPAYPDPNPYSILEYKTDPSYPGMASVANITPRNRTVQIENVYIANNLSTTVTYNPLYLYPKHIWANETTFAGINITRVIIDKDAGTVLVNATRPGGFSSATGARSSIFDVEYVYYNYTDTCCDCGFFGEGFLKNSTSGIDYPVSYFVQTNLSYLTWTTYSNFTVNNTAPAIGTPVELYTELNQTANMFTINWGDGTTETITHWLPNHTYSTIGSKDITVTAFIWQNESVTNTTYRLGAVDVTYAEDTLIADFVASATAVPPSSTVTFTSTSLIGNTSNVIYNWSFGDGGYSQNQTAPIHVYVYSGTYSVNLTLTNINILGESTDYEYKQDYIIVAQSEDFLLKYPPKDVRFHIQDSWGQSISNVYISAQGISTSTGSYDYVAQLFGYQLAEVPIANTQMNGTTDSRGDLTFAMLTTVKYNMTFNKTGYTFPEATPGLYITPHDDNYIITAYPVNGGNVFITNGSAPEANTNLTAWSYKINSTAGNITVRFEDSAKSTYAGRIRIYQSNRTLGYAYPEDQIEYYNETFVGYVGNASWESTGVAGESYVVEVQAATDQGIIVINDVVWFKRNPYVVGGLGQEFSLFVALFIMMFTSLLAGYTTAGAVGICVSFEGWMFYGMGMLDLIDVSLADITGTDPTVSGGVTSVAIALTLMTFISIMLLFLHRKKKG